MNKLRVLIKKIKEKIPLFTFKRNKISLSTQIIFTLFFVFVSFFILQTILNSQFFHNYYTDKEFDNVNESILHYVDKMNSSDNDYYEEMYELTTSQNVYSIITTKTFRILESSYTDYTIKITDNAIQNTYTLLIPDNTLKFTLDETLSIKLSLYNEEYYYPFEITRGLETIYQNTDSCPPDSCIEISGTISDINRPNNLNYQFADNTIVQNELSKLALGNIDFAKHQYDDGYWYRSSDNSIDSLVFIHELKNWDYIITIVPIEDTQSIINIVSQYNYYVYLTAIAIIFLWSFRLSSIISKPIQNIETVAKDIANLNFDVTANEYNNKETASLSNSMNLISTNLKTALETLHNKNEELTDLYDEQSKQVELKKRLVSSISHELKTPLMIIQVIIQGISDGVISEKDMKDELSTVLAEISKSSMMIQDMLQIYRLDNSETKLDLSEFNITTEVIHIISEFDQITKKQNLIFDFHSEDIYVEADIKLIRRVISNFITNAIKYTPKGEKIKINLSKSHDLFTFEIINYGVNINKNEIHNIWLPFYRGRETNYADQDHNGSGIGLYLVKEILIAHKSDFGITNINNGVRAFFSLTTKNDS